MWHRLRPLCPLVHINALRPQILPSHINFLHQFSMRLRDIVESQDTPSQFCQ